MKTPIYLYSTDENELFGTDEQILEWYNEENFEAHSDEKAYHKARDVLERDVRDFIDFQLEICYEDFKRELIDVPDVLVLADIGRWNGRYAGGDVGNLDDMISKILGNEDYFSVYVTDTLRVDTSNHDASSYFTIYKLTKKGKQWYENNEYKLSPRELHEHLRKTKGCTRKLKLKDVSAAWA